MTDKRPYKHPQFNLRIPQELKDKVEDSSNETGRSMNAEIVHRLEDSFNASTGTPDEIQKMYEMAFFAFKATSDNFEKELKDRMGQYAVQLLMRKHPELDLPPNVDLGMTLSDFIGDRPAKAIQLIADEKES